MTTAQTTDLDPPRDRALTVRIAGNLWKRLGIEDNDSEQLIATLVGTLMKPDAQNNYPSEQHVQAFLMVASQYRLNPWLKQIHAFVDSQSGGIVPVVGVDGWSQLINEHPQYDGCDFEYKGEGENLAITCVIYRKDRTRPIRVTEFLNECRGTSKAWVKTPKRMLRHRAFMQGGRIAFGLGGIHDEDDARAFAHPMGSATAVDPLTGAEQELMPTRRPAEGSQTPREAAQVQQQQPAGEIIDVQATERRTPASVEEAFGEPPAATPAPAPAAKTPAPPPPAPAAEPSADRMATTSEKAHLGMKARVKGIDLERAYTNRGYKADTLTASQFETVKAWIAEQ